MKHVSLHVFHAKHLLEKQKVGKILLTNSEIILYRITFLTMI